MLYIVATLLRKAFETKNTRWKELMLSPDDYGDAALVHPLTRRIMEKIDFAHGGAEYDAKYPDGIPTSLAIEHATLGTLDSGLVMYPVGHARNASGLLEELLDHKFKLLAGHAVRDVAGLYRRMTTLAEHSPADVARLYDFEILSKS
jgi:2-methylcitrate dehydratase